MLVRFILFFFCVFTALLTGCSSTNSVSVAQPLFSKNKKEGDLIPKVFTFNDGGRATYYTFDIGSPTENDPLIFLISGSGCASLKHSLKPYFRSLERILPAQIIMLQKRGINVEHESSTNCSSRFIQENYYQRILSDQKEFIYTQIAKRAHFSDRPVVIIGISEGSVIAAEIAARQPRVNYLALIGSGGLTFRQDLTIKLTDYGLSHESINDLFDKVANDPFSLTKKELNLTHKYLSSFLDINFGNTVLSLDIPVFIAMGEKDESVPVVSALELKKRFALSGKRNLKLYIYPNADHTLRDVLTTQSYHNAFLRHVADNIILTSYQKQEGNSQYSTVSRYQLTE